MTVRQGCDRPAFSRGAASRGLSRAELLRLLTDRQWLMQEHVRGAYCTVRIDSGPPGRVIVATDATACRMDLPTAVRTDLGKVAAEHDGLFEFECVLEADTLNVIDAKWVAGQFMAGLTFRARHAQFAACLGALSLDRLRIAPVLTLPAGKHAALREWHARGALGLIFRYAGAGGQPEPVRHYCFGPRFTTPPLPGLLLVTTSC